MKQLISLAASFTSERLGRLHSVAAAESPMMVTPFLDDTPET